MMKWANQISKHTAVSRKVVGRNMHATIRKGNMGYDQYTVRNDWGCRTYFCCFPLVPVNVCPWPPVTFVQISLNSALQTTKMPLGIVACTFSDNLSRNSCIHAAAAKRGKTPASKSWPNKNNLARACFESIKTHPEIRSIMRTLTSHLQTVQLFLVHRAPSSYLRPSITHFFCCNASKHLHCIGTNSSMVGWDSQKGFARTGCSTAVLYHGQNASCEGEK